MSNDMIPHTNGATPEFGVPSTGFDANAMATALQGVKREAAAGGQTYLRMDKTGTWVFGSEAEPVPATAEFAVDPYSFIHGYVAWGDLQKLGEAIVPINVPLPAAPAAPPGSRGWERQFGMTLKHVTGAGDDLGVLLFRSSSFGGRKCIAALTAEVGKRMATGQATMPIVKLVSTSYVHKKFGKIFEPEILIVAWIGGVDEVAGYLAPPPKKAAKGGARKGAR